jgi:hypothetical protein
LIWWFFQKKVFHEFFYRVWLARKIALLVSGIVLAYSALNFKDYNVINYQLLQDIRKQNAELTKAVELMKSGPTTHDVIDHHGAQVLDDHREDMADDEMSENDDDDDNLSFDSTRTDSSWMVDNAYAIKDFSDDEDHMSDILEEESASFLTTPVADNNVTPTNNTTTTAEDSIKDGTNIINVDSFEKPTPKRRGRPPGSRNSSRGGTPCLSNNHSYNLRQRRNNATFNGFDNPILDHESPNTFGHLVADAAMASKVTTKIKVTKVECWGINRV